MSVKLGFVKHNKVLVPCEFDEYKPMIVDGVQSKEIFKIKNKGKYALVKIPETKDGRANFTDTKYDRIFEYKNGLAIVTETKPLEGEKFGIVNIHFAEVVTCKYDKIVWISEDLLRVELNNKVGLYRVGCGMGLYLPCLFSNISIMEDLNHQTKLIIELPQ